MLDEPQKKTESHQDNYGIFARITLGFTISPQAHRIDVDMQIASNMRIRRSLSSAWRTDVSYLALSNQGWEQIANFLVSGSLCIAFAVGLRRIWRTGRASVWGPLLIGLFGLGLLIAGGCVADPGGGYPPGAPLNGNPQTWHGWVHGINGAVLFNVVLPAACFVLARRFAADPQNRRWAR